MAYNQRNYLQPYHMILIQIVYRSQNMRFLLTIWSHMISAEDYLSERGVSEQVLDALNMLSGDPTEADTNLQLSSVVGDSMEEFTTR